MRGPHHLFLPLRIGIALFLAELSFLRARKTSDPMTPWADWVEHIHEKKGDPRAPGTVEASQAQRGVGRGLEIPKG